MGSSNRLGIASQSITVCLGVGSTWKEENQGTFKEVIAIGQPSNIDKSDRKSLFTRSASVSKLSYYTVPTPPSPTPKLSSSDLQGQSGGLRMRFLNPPSLLSVYSKPLKMP